MSEDFEQPPRSADERSFDGGFGLRGRQLGRYRLVEEIGHGGQGFVYRARDERLQRDVALKILPRGHALSSAARIRFQREAEAAARLDHPGICRVFELAEDQGLIFIAMELVRGKTLARHLSETAEPSTNGLSRSEVHIAFDEEDTTVAADPVPPSEPTSSTTSSVDRSAMQGAVRFFESAALALHAAHREGLVHRDVKPGNLMIRENGSACVLDFGLAQDDLAETEGLTEPGDFFGTPAYMSPEQLLAHRVKLDRRTDIYSLGVCLFEACTLRRPFTASSNHELYQAIAHKEPPAPRSLNPRIPRDLEAIILTALEKDPDRRYASAEAFAEDLRRFRELEPVRARPAGPATRARRWVQRNRVLTLATTAIFLSLAVSTAVLFRSERRTQSALRDALRLQDLQARTAEQLVREQRAALTLESRRLTALAREEIAGGDPTTGILLALEALPSLAQPGARPWVPEARISLQEGLWRHREEHALFFPDRHARRVFGDARVLVVHEPGVGLAGFNPRNGKLRWRSKETAGPSPRIVASPDGAGLAVRSGQGRLVLLDPESGAERAVFHSSVPPGVKLSLGAAGRRLVIHDPDRQLTTVWDSVAHKTYEIPHHCRAAPVFNRDGERLLSITGGEALVRRSSDGEVLARLETGHEELSEAEFLEPTGRRIATGSEDLYEVWEQGVSSPRLRLETSIRWADQSMPLAWDATGERMLIMRSGELEVIELSTGSLLAKLPYDRGEEQLVAFTDAWWSPDGERLIVEDGRGSVLRVWNAETWSPAGVIRHHREAITTLRFDASSRLVASADTSGAVCVWDLESGRLRLRVAADDGVRALAFDAAAASLLTWGTREERKVARSWHLSPPLGPSRSPRHQARVVTGRLSADGSLAVTSTEVRDAHAWGPAIAPAELRAANGSAASARDGFHLDGARLLTREQGYRALFRRYALPPSPGATTLQPAEERMAASRLPRYGPTPRLLVRSETNEERWWQWDPTSGSSAAAPQGWLPAKVHQDGARAISRSGARVLVQGERGIGIWEVATGEVHETGIEAAFLIAEFSADDRWVAVARGERPPPGEFRPYWIDLTIHDARDGRRVLERPRVRAVSWPTRLAALCGDRLALTVGSSTEIVEIATGRLIRKLAGTLSSHSDDGEWLVLRRGEGIHQLADLVRLQTAQPAFTCRIRDCDEFRTIWSRDGACVAAIPRFGHAATVIDVGARRAIAELGPTTRIGDFLDLAAGADDLILLTGGRDGRARRWTTPRRDADLLRLARRTVRRALTTEERSRYFLALEPPRWCITGAGHEREADPAKWEPLWPYEDEAWRAWQLARDRGEEPELPRLEED